MMPKRPQGRENQAKHCPEDYGIRVIPALEAVEAGRAESEEGAQTRHNGPTKWKWAAVKLNDPLDYVTGRSVMALAAPNLGWKSCWYGECRNASGAPMETAMCGAWTEGTQITGKVLGRGLLTDIREGLRNAGHPQGRRKTAIAGATHVRAVLEMAWQHALEEALEGAAEKVENILDRRKLQRWLSREELEQVEKIGERMREHCAKAEWGKTWERWLKLVAVTGKAEPGT